MANDATNDFDISGLKNALGVSAPVSQPSYNKGQPTKESIMGRNDLVDTLKQLRAATPQFIVGSDLHKANLANIAEAERALGQVSEPQAAPSNDFDISGLKTALNVSPVATDMTKQFQQKVKPMFEPKTSLEQIIKSGIESIPGVKELGAFGQNVGGAISTSLGSLEQLAGQYMLGLSDESRAAIMRHATQNVQQTQEALKPSQEAYPASSLAGELTGYVASPVNKLVPNVTAARGLAGAGQAAGQGALQTVLTQPVTDPNEAFFTKKLEQAGWGGVGGAAGNALLKLPAAIAEPVKNTLGKIGNDAVKTLREAGVPLDVAQATGSAFWTRAKAMLSDNPFTSTAENTFASSQKEAFNKAIAKTMGEDATNITPNVIQTAKERLGGIYDDIASRNSIHYDDTLQKNLNDIRNQAELVLNDSQFNVIKKQIENIDSKANVAGGGINGTQYQSIKQVLDKLSASEDKTVAGYAREIKDSLLDGLSRTAQYSGNTADVAALKQANREYGNMKKIEDVVLKNPEGNVSPSLLMNSLATKGKRYSFYQDDPQLADLASAGKLILENKTPNSGTVARLMAQAAPAAIAGGAYGVYQGDLQSGLKAAALGYALPKAMQMGVNNPVASKYLEQGLPQGLTRAILEMPSKAGQVVAPYAARNRQSLRYAPIEAQPAIAGSTALRQLINVRNQQEQ
jgi:hypothetical protein